MIYKHGDKYAVSVYDPTLKRKRWVGTFAPAGRRDAEQRILAIDHPRCCRRAGLPRSTAAMDSSLGIA